MKRIIVDYSKLTSDILDLLVDKYPDGYDFSDVVSFKNSKGETIKAVEVRTEDSIYLVKISSLLEKTMEDYQEDSESFDEDRLNDNLDEIIEDEDF
jgi:hypothetical protein